VLVRKGGGERGGVFRKKREGNNWCAAIKRRRVPKLGKCRLEGGGGGGSNMASERGLGTREKSNMHQWHAIGL